MFKLCLILVLFTFVTSSSLLDDGIFYFVGADCYFKSSIGDSAHIDAINTYQITGNERPCENISSSIYQNPKGSHLIIIKYESPKEISILIQQIKSEATTINLKDSFKKANYDYILGDYCSFDKKLLSIGIDSNMLYTTVKCGGGAKEIWAFMRSILTLNGDFYTPSGPLIYFKNGDPSFDQLLFLSTFDGSFFDDTIVLRLNWALDGTLKYFSSYLHELNKTDPGIKMFSVPSTKRNMFSTSMGIIALFREAFGKTEISICEYSENTFLMNIKVQKELNSDYTVIRAWGYFPKLVYEKSETTTWNIHDTEKNENFEIEECNLSNKNEQCIEGNSDLDKTNKGSTHWYFYLIAGIEFIIFVAAFATLITLIILKRKKKISAIVSKRDGPAVTQIATVYSTQMDDVSNTTHTNNV